LNSEIIEKFKNLVGTKEADNTYSKVCIVLEFFVEKYRPMSDTRGLTTEQMEQIATMQSIQAGILEYNMQFQLATQSQEKLNEIAYTVAITLISTVTTMGIGGAAGWGTSGLMGIITEPLEEVFLDPFIEATVSGIIRELGGDEYAQMIASTLVESGREGGFGITSQRKAGVYRRLNQQYKIEGLSRSERRQKIKAEMKANQQEETTKTKVAKAALITLSIFGMLIGLGGIGLSAMSGIGTSTIGTFIMMGGANLVNFFGGLLQEEQDDQVAASPLGIAGLPSYDQKLVFASQFVKNLRCIGGLFDLSDKQKIYSNQKMLESIKKLSYLSSSKDLEDRTPIRKAPDYGYSFPKRLPRMYFTSNKKIVQKEPYSLRRIILAFAKVFTAEEHFILQHLESATRDSLSFKEIINEKNEKVIGGSLVHAGKTRSKAYISYANLLRILGFSESVAKASIKSKFRIIKSIVAQRYETYYRLGFSASALRARINSFTHPARFQRFDTLVAIFNKFLDDCGKNVRYTYNVLEIFNKYSSRDKFVGVREIRKLLKVQRLGLTLDLYNPLFHRLVNVELLSYKMVKHLGISKQNLKFLKKEFYDMTVDLLLAKNKLKSVGTRNVNFIHTSVPYTSLSRDTFRMVFRVLIAKNYEKGKGKLLSYKQSYKVTDLAKAISPKKSPNLITNSFRTGTLLSLKACIKMRGMSSSVTLRRHQTGLNARRAVNGFLFKYRPYSIGTYHKYWEKQMLVPQRKEMVDISLGLDVLSVGFFDDGYKIGIIRHHYEKDKPYYCIFQFRKDGTYKIKLLPLSKGSHWGRLHAKAFLDESYNAWFSSNELAEQRLLHLVKLIYEVKYNPRTNYRIEFMNQFLYKEVTIRGEKRLLWFEEDDIFENTRVVATLYNWIDRWVYKKKLESRYSSEVAENKWYKKYYGLFYRKTYKSYMKDYDLYLNGDPNCKRPDFWEWYHNTYVVRNKYPS